MLCYSESHSDRSCACRREYRIKKRMGREEKLALAAAWKRVNQEDA